MPRCWWTLLKVLVSRVPLVLPVVVLLVVVLLVLLVLVVLLVLLVLLGLVVLLVVLNLLLLTKPLQFLALPQKLLHHRLHRHYHNQNPLRFLEQLWFHVVFVVHWVKQLQSHLRLRLRHLPQSHQKLTHFKVR